MAAPSEKRRKKAQSRHPTKQLDRIYFRDKGICQLCFKICLREEASRDHIKELRFCNREEGRSDKNVRLAHIICNNARDKNISVLELLIRQLLNKYSAHRSGR